MFARWLAAALSVLAGAPSAEAHGIAGNRYFPGTLTFDDPAVADELILPNFSSLAHPNGNENVDDKIFAGAFTRLLTEKLAISVDSSWIQRNRTSFPQQAGFGLTSLSLKGQVLEDDPHEALIAASLAWGIGRLGNQAVDAGGPSALQPGVFFGKGLGDLPDRMAWLRPFGVAGAVTAEFPISRRSTTTGIDPATGRLGLVPTINGNILHWGLALEYSTLYLTDRFTGGPPKEEPLHQFVPLVEFAFDTPIGRGFGHKTAGTANPGLSYVAETWQLAAEAILPMNREAGRGVGARIQLLLFLDDLVPTLFGKPLLSQ
jgi:hypothetical protein